MEKIRIDDYDNKIIGVYKNRNFYYEYTNRYLYIISIVQRGETAKVKYYLYEEWGRVYTKKIYGMDNEPYFIYPFFTEIENFDMTEEEIFKHLCEVFFGTGDYEDLFDDKPGYTAENCIFVRDYDKNVISNLS